MTSDGFYCLLLTDTQMTPMMRQARCCMVWTPCQPSSDATSTKITAGSSRSSVNGRSSSARLQHHRESLQPLQSPRTPVQLIHTKHQLSQHSSQEHPLKSQIREPLQSHSQSQNQRRSQSLIPVRRRKVCCGDWREGQNVPLSAQWVLVQIAGWLPVQIIYVGIKGSLLVVMNEFYNF